MKLRENPNYWIGLLLLSIALIGVDYMQTQVYMNYEGIQEVNPLTRWWIASGLDLLSFFALKIVLFLIMVAGFYWTNQHRLPLVIELMFLVNMAVVLNNMIVVWLGVV